jgi:hypothetical protein
MMMDCASKKEVIDLTNDKKGSFDCFAAVVEGSFDCFAAVVERSFDCFAAVVFSCVRCMLLHEI